MAERAMLQRFSLIRRIVICNKMPIRYSASSPTGVPTGLSDKETRLNLNKGRLDWLFPDGYRRPLAEDQGGKMRKDWICYGYHPTNEYLDWKYQHLVMFILFSMLVPTSVIFMYYRSDWPDLKEWAHREAYMELERREKAGLPLISKDFIDPKLVLATLPSDEEIGDFKVII